MQDRRTIRNNCQYNVQREQRRKANRDADRLYPRWESRRYQTKGGKRNVVNPTIPSGSSTQVLQFYLDGVLDENLINPHTGRNVHATMRAAGLEVVHSNAITVIWIGEIFRVFYRKATMENAREMTVTHGGYTDEWTDRTGSLLQ